MDSADAHAAHSSLARGFKAKVEEADAHDAGLPGGSRPKWGQLMLIMHARQGFKAKVGAADAHDSGLPGGSRPKWQADAHAAVSPGGSRPK